MNVTENTKTPVAIETRCLMYSIRVCGGKDRLCLPLLLTIPHEKTKKLLTCPPQLSCWAALSPMMLGPGRGSDSTLGNTS